MSILGSFRSGLNPLIICLFSLLSLSFSGSYAKDKNATELSNSSQRLQYYPGEVIIKFRPTAHISLTKQADGTFSSGIQSVDALLRQFSGEELASIFPSHTRPAIPDGVDLTRFYRFRYRSGIDPMKVARTLQSAGAIQYAEPRYIRYVHFTPNDPEYGRQWYLRKIQADKAWDFTQGDTSVIIGIIDTGVDWKHLDLRQNIWRNPRPGQDPNFPADSIGWDFGGFNGAPDNDPDEDQPVHGTGVAGIVSAVTNNGIGIAGVGFKCKLMAVKTNRSDRANEILYGYEGIVYAADRGAAVINASWGGPGYSQFEQEVINYATAKGALVVAAAGNGGTREPLYPAGYANALAVAATDTSDKRSIWSFFESSNFGLHIDVSAPGTAIYSTWKVPSYLSLSGTSFSTALVSGAAALIKSRNPSWTPAQITQQIRVTADSIDELNPGLSRSLGRGRLNVFRAVTDSTSPGLQMVSFTVSDSIGGNNDRSIDPGETIRIVGVFRNFLRPTVSAVAQLTTSDPFITITSGSSSLGGLGTLQSSSNVGSPFVFRVSSQVPENHRATFYVILSDGQYQDYTGFTLTINATYKDHNINDILMTVTSRGTLGFNDYPNNLEGTGFVFRRGGDENLLFEGAFMAGTDVSHVVDAARTENEQVQSTDFISLQRFSFSEPPIVSGQDGSSIFSDGGAGTNQVGLRVRLTTYAYKDPPDNAYILLKYTIANTKGTSITNLHAGLYFDWDVPESFYDQNVARLDAPRRLGYIFDSRPGGPQIHTGAVLLTPGAIHFRAIDNNDQTPGNPWGVYDGFTKAEKWQALSGGTQRIQDGPGDVSMVIGTGPLSVPANDSVVVGFALVAATDLTGLQAAADAARQKWSVLVTSVEKIASEIPSKFFLHQNYPNPFNPATKIAFDVPRESYVTLGVYNVLGQEVVRLVDGVLEAGRYETPLSALHLSSGVYFYRIQAGSYTQVRKMVLLR